MDELIGNLETYEMKRKKDSERREPKKEKNLVLKAKSSDSSEEDNDMAFLTKRFQKMVRRNGGIPKRGSSNSSSESEREPDVENNTMIVVETEATKYDSLFALMAQSDNDEEDEDDEEKEVLNEKVNSVENERDDLMLVVVDLKEIIEGLSNEKHTLEEKVAATKQERDDFLVIITNLEGTIEGLNRDHRTVSIGKGKEVDSETHIKLEKELNDVKSSLCGELEKNRQLQAELEKGIGFQKEKTLYNPHSKYVTVPDNWLCTHCGNKGRFRENWQARVQSVQKNKVFAEKVTTKEGPGNSKRKQTAMDNG
ncbi:uncharacterized protein [Nicotiana sylvestris]|uniref:uncharacterized protein n=1 Tax=Nicotiana sylvestris TaxID=4096 RepID=UPI00388CD749